MRCAQVLVVGGGPAGASTAAFLAQAGIDVAVIDRARFPRDKPCSEYLSPEASRLLASLGVLDQIEAQGPAHLEGMTVRAPNGARLRGDFVGQHGFRGFRDRGIAIRRTILDAILLDRARALGASVHEGERALDVLRDANGTVTGVRTLSDDGTERSREAALVVGADGLRSIVAHRLGLSRRASWPRRLALVTHYRGVADLGSVGEMHVERDGYFGIAHVGDGIANVALVVPARVGRRLAGAREAFLERWIADHGYLAPRFNGAERLSPVAVTGPFASAARRAWAPGAALVGDAADFYDPFTGEGIFAALRGGELLADHAASALRARTLRGAHRELAQYDRMRRRAFRGKWLVERLVGAAVGFAPLMNRAARVLAVRKDMADLFVGVTGDFVPPAEILRPGYLLRLLLSPATQR